MHFKGRASIIVEMAGNGENNRKLLWLKAEKKLVPLKSKVGRVVTEKFVKGEKKMK